MLDSLKNLAQKLEIAFGCGHGLFEPFLQLTVALCYAFALGQLPVKFVELTESFFSAGGSADDNDVTLGRREKAAPHKVIRGSQAVTAAHIRGMARNDKARIFFDIAIRHF